MGLYPILRPLLFALPADAAHDAAHAALSWPAPWRLLGRFNGLADDNRLATRYAGIPLRNPVGLAAGFDKDGDLVAALAPLGFGFLTVGSVMAQVRPGHARPRLVRYPERLSLADSMGLPSKGRDHVRRQLEAIPDAAPPVFANVAGSEAREIVETVALVEECVDAIEISLICPNVVRPDDFDAVALLRQIMAEATGPTITVRVPNDVAKSDSRLGELIACCVETRVAGIKIGGGRPVAETRLGAGRGTLHGRDIHAQAMENLERAAALAAGRLDIKANGGIMTGGDVAAMLRAGACCVDLYSAFIYRGWNAAGLIKAELRDLMDLEGVATVADLTGRAGGAAI